MAQAAQETSLDRLKAFLNELFQYETQDLDFGVYKILGYKQREIKKFIDELLVDKIKEQLDTLTEKESAKPSDSRQAVYWLKKIAESGGVQSIKDPVTWQKDIRK